MKRKMSNREMSKLEDRFYRTFKRPVCKPVQEVFTDWVVHIQGYSFNVEFLAKADRTHGLKPLGLKGSRSLAQSLIERMSFIPPVDLIERVIACESNHRVGYLLKSGVQVVDDTRGNLAVHVMQDPLLAESLVQGWITVKSAKRADEYLARIPHCEGYEAQVMEAII
tara:strand:+ start:1840 stop:2340 length:501 start_codon:yes stop_codon:yes gene_type:complete